MHRIPQLRSKVGFAKSLRPTRSFTVLALESSADDTCASVVTSSREILSNVVVRQDGMLEMLGGIHPYIAIEAHQRKMPGAVRRALEDAKIKADDVDGIAYTRGPGMAGCLSVGSNAAKTLAAALNKPLVGVHHMQAHALTPMLTAPESDLPQFPFLTLLISGGHTLLLLATSLTSFRILATTVDESVGRTFDKVSRKLDIPWSGMGPGAALEKFCATDHPGIEIPYIDPPLPLAMAGELAFSYSGLHSAIDRYITSSNGIQNLDLPTKLGLARAFQAAAVAQLEEKLALGLNWCQHQNVPIRHVVVSGGVASNAFLRERLKDCLYQVSPDVPIALLFPPPELCTDNAAMIAWASMHRFISGDYDDYSIELRSKWSIEKLTD